GAADRVEDAAAVVGHLDQRGPPVALVRPPPGQAPFFEGVHHLGGRARRDAQPVRQLRQAHDAVAPEHAQGPQLSWGDVPGGQGLLGRVAQPPRDGPEGLRQRLVTAAERAQAREVSLRRIGRLFTPYRWQLAVVTAIIVASSIVGLASPFLLRAVIDTALPARNVQLLAWLVIGMVAVAAITSAFGVVQLWISTTV